MIKDETFWNTVDSLLIIGYQFLHGFRWYRQGNHKYKCSMKLQINYMVKYRPRKSNIHGNASYPQSTWTKFMTKSFKFSYPKYLAVLPALCMYVLASSGQSICITQLTAGKSTIIYWQTSQHATLSKLLVRIKFFPKTCIKLTDIAIMHL